MEKNNEIKINSENVSIDAQRADIEEFLNLPLVDIHEHEENWFGSNDY